MLEGARMNPRIRYTCTILQMMALFVVSGGVEIFSFHGGLVKNNCSNVYCFAGRALNMYWQM